VGPFCAPITTACTTACTSEAENDNAGPVEALAATLQALSPADRLKLAALLAGQAKRDGTR
jgi:hypothetical protein